jgi:hypothetical protein
MGGWGTVREVIPEIVDTERLLMKRASVEDARDLFATHTADPEVVRCMPWAPHADVEVTKDFFKDQVD